MEGDVGLGLVVVVVTDEVAHRVVRQEQPELVVELCRQRLVGRDHQRRPVDAADDVGHGEGLARTRDPQQHLVPAPPLQPSHQFLDGPGLVPLGLEVRHQAKPAGLALLQHVKGITPRAGGVQNGDSCSLDTRAAKLLRSAVADGRHL